jgi:MFS transporter, MHS family, proline/betaine transporter
MVELVPQRVRCTVVSLGYNTCLAVLGGLTPMVAVFTVHPSHDDLSPAFLLMAAGAISLAAVAGLRETYRVTLPSPAAGAA